jgi:branched-chain amino acid transport system substrate-binding protein
MLAPLSGPYGNRGRSQTNGLELALKHINDTDQLLSDVTLDISEGDTKTDPETAQSEARRLVQQENVDLLAGGTSSSVASVLSKFAASEEKLHFIMEAADQSLTTGEDCRPTTYRPHVHTSQIGKVAGDWCTNNLGENAFILYQDYSYGHAVRDAVTEAVNAAGGSVVDTAATPLGNQQFGAIIDRIQSTDADWVLMGAVGSGAPAFLSQAAERGLSIPMGTQALPSNVIGGIRDDLIDTLPDLYRTPAMYTRELDSSMNNSFVEEFLNSYGYLPNESDETGYMVGRFIGEGLHNAGTLSPSEARDSFEGLDFTSPRGSNTVRSCDHQGIPSVYITRITGIDEEASLANNEVVEELDSDNYTIDCGNIECDMS